MVLHKYFGTEKESMNMAQLALMQPRKKVINQSSIVEKDWMIKWFRRGGFRSK